MLKPALVISLLVALSAPLPAACPTSKVFGASYRVSYLDLTIDGTRLWAATSHGVEILDRSSNPPRRVVGLALPGPTNVVRAAGELGYVASGTSVFVVRYSGGTLTRVASVDVGGAIRDLLLAHPHLYVAASNGVTQLDLFVADRPAIATKLSATTTGGASSLARHDNILYVADGDISVEAFTLAIPSLPQKIGTFNALPQTTTVEVNGPRLYVSDGQQTQIFSAAGASSTRLGSTFFGSTSLFPIAANVAWVAGTDRRVRAIDFGNAAAATTLWQTTVPASRGTINRVTSMVGAPGVLYVGVGDAGIVTLETNQLTAPYAIRSFTLNAGSSAAVVTGGIVVAPPDGGLTLHAGDASALQMSKTWESGTWNLRDASGTRVLASNSNRLAVFDTAASPVVATSSATLRSPVRGAVLVGATAYAVLDDTSVWRVTTAASSPAPELSEAAGAAHSISRGGSAVATTQLNGDGTTTIRSWLDGDLTRAAQSRSVEGAATIGVALGSAGRVVAATFRGISILDFSNGSVELITGTPPAVAMRVEGDRLLFATASRLQTYDLATRRLVAEVELPSPPLAFARGDSSDVSWVTGGDTLTAVRSAAVASMPTTIVETGSRFFRSLAVDGQSLYLIEGDRADVFLLDRANRPSFASSISLDASTIDVAAGGGKIFALTSAPDVIAYGASGQELSRLRLNESADQSSLSIDFIGGALHVGVLKGCSVGSCEKKTLVIDPRAQLVQTSSYGGALVDFALNGTSAAVITDLPSELRRLSLSDPYRPAVVAAVPLLGAPVSVAWSSAPNVIYVLGDKLSAHDAASLARTADLLPAYIADPTGRVSYVDQQVRVSGDCAVVVGRSFAPQSFAPVASGAPALQTLDVPAAGKRVVLTPTAIFVLTDYSLEVFAAQPLPGRKRSVQ